MFFLSGCVPSCQESLSGLYKSNDGDEYIISVQKNKISGLRARKNISTDNVLAYESLENFNVDGDMLSFEHNLINLVEFNETHCRVRVRKKNNRLIGEGLGESELCKRHLELNKIQIKGAEVGSSLYLENLNDYYASNQRHADVYLSQLSRYRKCKDDPRWAEVRKGKIVPVGTFWSDLRYSPEHAIGEYTGIFRIGEKYYAWHMEYHDGPTSIWIYKTVNYDKVAKTYFLNGLKVKETDLITNEPSKDSEFHRKTYSDAYGFLCRLPKAD